MLFGQVNTVYIESSVLLEASEVSSVPTSRDLKVEAPERDKRLRRFSAESNVGLQI